MFSWLLAVLLICIGLVVFAHDSRDVCVYRTGRMLDLAIVGRGYFVFHDRETLRERYTRRGRLHINVDGVLACNPHPDSPFIQPAICIPPEYTSVAVTPDGRVLVHCPNDYTGQPVGELQLAVFADDAGLDSTGDGWYVANEDSGTPILAQPGGPEAAGFIQQFWLEERPPADGPRVLALLAVGGCGLVLTSLYWISRRLRRLEAGVGQLLPSREGPS
jgi:hypothetical protein